jgi:hypothetical protein
MDEYPRRDISINESQKSITFDIEESTKESVRMNITQNNDLEKINDLFKINEEIKAKIKLKGLIDYISN